jgi:predicted O-methyltransferase YrrM
VEGAQGRSLLDELSASGPSFHGRTEDEEFNWGLNHEALGLLAELVSAGQRTLETGVGCSTVVFAANGAHHTVVSPFAVEHERVRSWCAEHDVDLSAVTFVAQPSQVALPALEATPLDLVLIDGDHAFPSPFIDFYYAGWRMVRGGLLVVDDTNLRACSVLVDFLAAERTRWRLHTELRTTTVFERLDGPLVPPGGWRHQPWGSEPLRPGSRPTALQWIRARARLRTRLRARRR